MASKLLILCCLPLLAVSTKVHHAHEHHTGKRAKAMADAAPAGASEVSDLKHQIELLKAEVGGKHDHKLKQVPHHKKFHLPEYYAKDEGYHHVQHVQPLHPVSMKEIHEDRLIQAEVGEDMRRVTQKLIDGDWTKDEIHRRNPTYQELSESDYESQFARSEDSSDDSSEPRSGWGMYHRWMINRYLSVIVMAIVLVVMWVNGQIGTRVDDMLSVHIPGFGDVQPARFFDRTGKLFARTADLHAKGKLDSEEYGDLLGAAKAGGYGGGTMQPMRNVAGDCNDFAMPMPEPSKPHYDLVGPLGPMNPVMNNTSNRVIKGPSPSLDDFGL